MKEINFDLGEIHSVADKVLKTTQQNTFAFYGQMGSGKTTFIKAMVQVLGGVDYGHSPTFGLVNEYQTQDGALLAYHFDFYRIQSEIEALDFGIEDYFASNAYLFIEWPEKIPTLLPAEHIAIHLQFIDQNTRKIAY